MTRQVFKTGYLDTPFNICSRQESQNVWGWAKDHFPYPYTVLHRTLKMHVVCRIISYNHILETSPSCNSTEIWLRITLPGEKDDPHSIASIMPLRHNGRKKLTLEKRCPTIFYEDFIKLQEIQADPKSKDTSTSSQKTIDTESYVKTYCLTAQLRPGVLCVKFWQYSNASVTVVNDGNCNSKSNKDDAKSATEVFEPRQSDNSDDKIPVSVTFSDTRIQRQVISMRKYLASKNLDSPIVSLTQVDPTRKTRKKKRKKSLVKALHKITNLPRRFLKLREIKISQSSLTIIAYPGRRKSSKGGQRSRQRAQNQTAPDESSDNPRIPVQVTQLDDIDQRPSRDAMVTSVETIFTRRAPPVTTNLMSSIESEQRLAARRQGLRRLQNAAGTTAGATAARPPKYPEFTDQTKRQLSFMTWPASAMQDSGNMARQGFFYTGRLDLVRCFRCGIGLKDWSDSDEPLFEHIRHSPDCTFLLETLGPELLAAYKVNLLPSGAQPTSGGPTESRPAQGTGQGSDREATTLGTGRSAATNMATSNIRSPEYITLESRIESFGSGWPSTISQTPRQLAEAGFYFTGHGDICRCYTCDGGLQRWDPQDDPWIEHARWFPECNHVRQTRGQDFIDLVQRAVIHGDEEPVSGDSLVGAMGGLSFERGVTDPLSTDAAKKALEMGFSKKAVLLAVHELNAKGKTELIAASIIDVLNSKTDRGEALPTDTPPNEAEDDSEAENDPEFLQRENERLKSILKCLKCEERDANMLFIPCTHHRMCEECAADTLLCPVCGRDIEKKVKTYMS